MILLPDSVRIYVSASPTNLRKSFEGLSNEVRAVFAADPLCGHLFLFVNRRANQLKVLFWTRGGFLIVHKRLEQGRFSFPARLVPGAKYLELDVSELAMLLEGLMQGHTRAAKRWRPSVGARQAHAPF